MSGYKDLNVYQRAYKLAIDLHNYLEREGGDFTSDEIYQLKGLSRDVIANIAEGFSQKINKSKRFYNFKAIDNIHVLMMDLNFLHDTKRIPDHIYSPIYEGYDICNSELHKTNTNLINGCDDTSCLKHPTLNNK